MVLRALLLAHPSVGILVTRDNVVAGAIEQGSPLPAIGIKEVSQTEFATVARAERRVLVRARVQVTVYAKTYREQKALLLAVKLGPGVHTGIVAGVKVRSVVRGDVGPDFTDDAAEIFEQSRDFFVTYVEAA